MMKLPAATTPLALAIAGCAGGMADAPPASTAPISERPQEGACDAEAATRMVGIKATQAVGERILRFTGARSLRWGPPNSAWTMDYREDRVNVRYDGNMMITAITCG